MKNKNSKLEYLVAGLAAVLICLVAALVILGQGGKDHIDQHDQRDDNHREDDGRASVFQFLVHVHLL